MFSDGGFINAIIVGLMHPYPPKLVRQIVSSPPDCAVKTSTPVVYVLCQRNRSYYRRNSESLSTKTGAAATNDDGTSDSEDSVSMSQGGLNPRSDKKSVLKKDLNLQTVRSRVESVDLTDVISSDSNVPEETNIFRNELLSILNNDPTETENEQLIGSVAALLLTILRVTLLFELVYISDTRVTIIIM